MSELTVAEIVQEYLVSKVAAERAGLISKKALAKAGFYCFKFSKDFGHLPISQCRRGDLRRWVIAHPEFKSPHTKHDAAGAIVTAFRWAAEDGLISVCPYTKPRDLPAPEPRQPIKPEEVKLILASAHSYGHRPTRRQFRLAVWFLWETGCRTCEMFRLTWEMLDEERRCFEFRSKTTGKTGKTRLVALTKRGWRFVCWLRWRQVRIRGAATGPVFLNGRGREWNKDTFGKLFRRHANAAGVRKEVSAYCIRHGFCCELAQAGQSNRQIADVMGHASTRTADWYARGVKSNVDYLRAVSEARRKK